MSLLDQARKLEQQVMDRLKELEPLTREYAQLRKFAQRLGLKYSPKSGDAEGEAQRTTARGGTRARADGRSGRPAARLQATRSPARTRAAQTPAKPRGARPTSGRRAASRARPTSASATAAADKRKRPDGGGQRSGRRAAAARPGQRHDDVLRVVGASPGITVREIGERLGVDATGLYRVVKRLTDEGRLRKDGPRLHPAESATTPEPQTASASPSPAGGATQPPEATASTQSPSPLTAADTTSPAET
jgi:hypothetical protein